MGTVYVLEPGSPPKYECWLWRRRHATRVTCRRSARDPGEPRERIRWKVGPLLTPPGRASSSRKPTYRSQMSAIRRVLARAPQGEQWIETLTSPGYRFVGPVTRPEHSYGVADPATSRRRSQCCRSRTQSRLGGRVLLRWACRRTGRCVVEGTWPPSRSANLVVPVPRARTNRYLATVLKGTVRGGQPDADVDSARERDRRLRNKTALREQPARQW